MAKLLSGDEAQRVGLRFIQGIYYRGKISINQIQLVTAGAFPVYHLEGTIQIPSRNLLGRLIAVETPYAFKMQVHAEDGNILNYELR